MTTKAAIDDAFKTLTLMMIRALVTSPHSLKSEITEHLEANWRALESLSTMIPIAPSDLPNPCAGFTLMRKGKGRVMLPTKDQLRERGYDVQISDLDFDGYFGRGSATDALKAAFLLRVHRALEERAHAGESHVPAESFDDEIQ